MGASRLWSDAVRLARLFSLTHQGKLAEWDSGVSFNSEINSHFISTSLPWIVTSD